MHHHVYTSWILSALTIASSLSLAPSAIAHPASMPLPANLPLNRFSRDLVPSASKEFFNRGRVQLERELQQLATNRQTLDDLLKVTPDPRPLSEDVKQEKKAVECGWANE